MSTSAIELRYALDYGGFSLDADIVLPMRGVSGVFGVSGSGKTTLLRCIAGLEAGTSGKLVVDGEVWQDEHGGVSRPTHQREIGYVFQEPRLFSNLDVRRNLAYGVKRRRTGAPAIGFDQIVGLLGLEDLLERRPDALSGGEAQRVAIARALLRAPRFVLMDEPLAALDRQRKDEVLPFFDRLHAELAIPIVYVSHSIDEICRLCDHLVVMQEGRVVANGELQSVLSQLDLPMLAGEEAGSVIQTTVIDYDADDKLTRLGFSGGEFLVAGRAGRAGQPLRLRIKANDISLCRERPRQTTILNIVPAEVDELRECDDSMTLVRLKVGSDRLVARITRRSCREMRLEAGDRLLAQIKSAAIRSAPDH